MGRAQVLDAALRNRHKYLWEDPVRFACIVCAGMLYFLPVVPFAVTLFVVGVLQLSAVALITRFSLPGWSYQWGKHHHPGILATGMCVDWANLSACTIVGAMLFVRHFNGSEALLPLLCLTAGVCLLPDVRLCRLLLSRDPLLRSEHLRTGYFWRDPVKLSAILSMAVVCWLDRNTLNYLVTSLIFLQLNSLLIMIDKYLSEIESSRPRGLEALILEREGRRFLFCLSPLALVPIRHFFGDPLAFMTAAMLAGLIVVPDLIRFAMAAVASAWGWIWKPRRREQPITQSFTIIGVLKG